MVLAFLQLVADRRQRALAVIHQLQRTKLGDLAGKPLCGVSTGLLDPRVALTAQPQEIVVLRDDLATRPAEVQREGRHVAAEVVHIEDQLIGQFRLVAPDDPADAQRRQPVFVARRADRLHPLNAESPIPAPRWMNGAMNPPLAASTWIGMSSP